MKQYLKRGLALLMALVICVGLMPTIQIFAAGTNVQYVYSSEGYIYNWGTREVEATFLSPNAEAFYTGNNTYDVLSGYTGGTGTSNAANSQLYKALQNLMVSNHKTQTSYNATRTMYQYTDCENSGKTSKAISCFYTGNAIGPAWDGGSTWNREHTWPNSKGMNDNGENDIMMLRPTSSSVNSSRGNKAYGESSGYYNPNSASNNKHDLRGDVARIFLYMYVRWGYTNGNSEYGTVWGTSGVIESLTVLLNWMKEDPVDTWELGRNDSVQSITGTRNVFVDYPEYAYLLFGQDVPNNMVTPSGEAINDSSCEHNFKAGTVVPATCTSKGYTIYTCTLCGISKESDPTAVIPHSYANGLCVVCRQPEPRLPLDGDKVVIYAPGYDMALSANKTGYYNVGVDVSEGFDAITDAEIWNVTVNADGTYSFVSETGTKLALGSSYTSLDASGANDDWVITSSPDVVGIYYIKNSVRGCYLEWYAEKGNWSTYATTTLFSDFEMSFYIIPEACKHTNTQVQGSKPASCINPGATGKTVCLDCGVVVTESTVISANGHTLVNGTCSVCGAVAGAASSATISFADKANRIEQTTSKQVWQQNGITVTNNKSSSSSNVADYANPARFYKGSVVIVEHPNMSKIEFTCNTAAYATALKSSISADGASVTVSGAVVTVEFADACDSFSVTLTGGQVRVNEITVHGQVSCEHTPGTALKENVTAESYDSVVYCAGCGVELSRETVVLMVSDSNAKFLSTGLSLGTFIGLQNLINPSKLNGGVYDEVYYIYEQYSSNDAGVLELIDTARGEFMPYSSYLVADVSVNAKQMSDTYVITPYYVVNGITYKGVSTTTSVKDEAMKKINATATDDKTLKTKALCIAMLNYGAEAQKTFKYSQTNYANSQLTTQQKTLTAFEDLALVKKNTIPTTPFKPASSGLSLGDVVYMQFLVKKSDLNANSAMKYQIPGEDEITVAVADMETYGGTYYLINIPIKAKYVRSDIAISFVSENYTMVCSIEAFAVAKEATSTEALVCALMDYGDAAKALFG